MSKPKTPVTILTASSLASLTSCARRYYLSYELGLRKKDPAEALRFGTAYHAGLEARGKGADAVTSVTEAIKTAGDVEFDEVTAEKINALLLGYFSKWGDAVNDPMIAEITPEVEFCFKLPFLRGFAMAGKIDGIVLMQDGRRGLIEHKTTSEDISWDSEYWHHINRDQIALYGIAIETMKLAPVDVYVYDVIRKPTIRQTQKETPAEYGERLTKDATEVRPDFYYARREIPLLDCDREGLARRLMSAANLIKHYRKESKKMDAMGAWGGEAWLKCGSIMTCKACPFRGMCDSAEIPEGFEAGRAHEELATISGKTSPLTR